MTLVHDTPQPEPRFAYHVDDNAAGRCNAMAGLGQVRAHACTQSATSRTSRTARSGMRREALQEDPNRATRVKRAFARACMVVWCAPAQHHHQANRIAQPTGKYVGGVGLDDTHGNLKARNRSAK